MLLGFIGFAIYYVFVRPSTQKNSKPVTTTQTVSQDKTPTESVANIINNQKDLTQYEKHLKTNAMYVVLDGNEQYTVFATSNAGYDSADQQVKEIFKINQATPAQKSILNYSMVSGIHQPANLSDGQKLKTINGGELVVKIVCSNIYLTDMKDNVVHITTAGIPAKNGSVYIVDSLLLPQ